MKLIDHLYNYCLYNISHIILIFWYASDKNLLYNIPWGHMICGVITISAVCGQKVIIWNSCNKYIILMTFDWQRISHCYHALVG